MKVAKTDHRVCEKVQILALQPGCLLERLVQHVSAMLHRSGSVPRIGLSVLCYTREERVQVLWAYPGTAVTKTSAPTVPRRILSKSPQ